MKPGRQTASLAERWYVAIMMCLVYTLSISDRYSISTVLEPIRKELHLSDANIAFLTGVSLAIFYVLFGFPLSWLLDRRSRRNIIGICLIAWSVLTAATGIARSYWQLLWARIGVGVGEAGGTPGANSILSDFFPALAPRHGVVGLLPGRPDRRLARLAGRRAIAYRFGWRAMFLALGIPGVLVGLLVLGSIREPRRGCLDECEDRGASPSFFETMRFLLRQRSTVHSILAQSLTALWGWGLMWWTPAFLMRSYSLNVAQAGGILGPIHLIGGSAGDGGEHVAAVPSLALRRAARHAAARPQHRPRHRRHGDHLLDPLPGAHEGALLAVRAVHLRVSRPGFRDSEQSGAAAGCAPCTAPYCSSSPTSATSSSRRRWSGS